jgi:hypothetical protein
MGAPKLVARSEAPSHASGHHAASRVAIVVPLSSRPELGPEEELSLRHLCYYLGQYDKYLVAPTGSTFQRRGFRTLLFPRKFFGSVAAHNHLLMWPRFYRSFKDYEYILMYHLDSLVFSDALGRWCEAGWDYIGAPWLPCDDTPWVDEARVGNGGFTLMKVQSVLRVLDNRHRQAPASYWADLLTRNARWTWPLFAALEGVRRRFPRLKVVRRALDHWHATQHPAKHGRNNDRFWSYEASRYWPPFRIAPVDQGLQFAFEAAPRLCFELNHRRLPFGCHAWMKFDREFWKPYLLCAGETMDTRDTVGTEAASAGRYD